MTINETDFLKLTKYLRFVIYIIFLMCSFLFKNNIVFNFNHFIILILLLSVTYNFKLKFKLRVLQLITIVVVFIILVFFTLSDYFFSFNSSDFFKANEIISISNFKLSF